ncbi:co-chaperone GroES [Puniceicoccales bacterium CK1056]|uniref:Co-chaperonin GroES n=1 Tax=Oceanipulchritudo coccoides TaxID=2706888 RepID=A0A6B2LYY9_9BACT|nr:co-chaperone GroES [Oceanipulchritudo coccoides]NDV61276.1 co-chaperone GroES [Oceanipulchritudo coccoides]
MAKNKVKITPLGDRVLVKTVSVEEEVKGGIIIPDSAKEKPTTAEVLALGNGKKDGEKYEFSVKVGDTVIISKYGGTQVKYDDVEYTILREDDILGVIA